MSIEAAVTGRVATAAELKTSVRSGKPWASCSLAVSEGADTTQVTWVRVAMFGSLAEEMAPKIEKGVRLYAEGRLTMQAYTAKDGTARSGLQLAAHHITIMGPKANKPPRRGADGQERAPSPDSAPAENSLNSSTSQAKRDWQRPAPTDPRPANGAPADSEIPF